MEKLELDIQMFADGKVVIEVALDEKQFTNGLNKLQSKTKGAGSSIKSIVAGLGITKLIGSAFNTITSSADKAIKRLDTFSQFPKVMQNFGVGADEAQASIKRIDEATRGLPIALDQSVSGVQNLFMVTKDLKQAEGIFKAVTDSAMVFAGGSTDAIDRFSYAFKQAMSSGKVSAQDFNQMNEAIPGLMDKVAQSMGMSYATLKKGLSDGSISMEQFNSALLKLDKEGGAGMSALSESARSATGGIQTSIENAKTAIVRGVAGIIQAFDVRLENTPFGSLSGLIQQAGDKASKALGMVADLISGKISATDFGKNVGDLINKTLKQLIKDLPKFLDIGIKMLMELIKGFAKSIPDMIKNVISLVMSIVDTIIDNLDEIIDAGLEILLALIDGIVDNIDKIIGAIFKVVIAIQNKLGSKEVQEKLWSAAGKIIAALVVGLIRAIPTLLNGVKQINTNIINQILKIPERAKTVGKNIVKGIWNGIKERGAKLKEDVKEWAQGIVDSIKKKLKIKSPSRVFRDEVGKMMAEGIGVGFKDEIDNVYKEMQKTIDIETDKMSANVETNGSYQVAMKGTPAFNLKDNSTNQTQLVVDGRVLAEVVNTENRNREVAKA